MTNTTIETKYSSVTEFAANAVTKQDKNKLEIILSYRDAIPGIMNFPVIRTDFIFMSETLSLYKLIHN